MCERTLFCLLLRKFLVLSFDQFLPLRSQIRRSSFWDPSEFSWLADVSERFDDIRSELDRYLELTGNGPFATQPASARLEAAPHQWNSVHLTSGDVCDVHFPKVRNSASSSASVVPPLLT